MAVESSIAATYYQAGFYSSEVASRYNLDVDVYDQPLKEVVSRRYICTISRTAMPTITVPISGFQLRVKRQTQDTLLYSGTAHIPAPDTIDNIALYFNPGTTIELTIADVYDDGSMGEFTVCSIDYNGVQINSGKSNKTASISGISYEDVPSYAIYTPRKVRTYNTDITSKATIRCNPQFGLASGMAVYYDSKYWAVDEIIYNIGTSSADMDISMVR